MFQHKGKPRTYIHNLRLASLLSFVAGIVNVTGFLSVKVLTTNVTGHFAFFTQELSERNYPVAIAFLLFILAFLFGAFVSNFLLEWVSKTKPDIAYIPPMLVEIFILVFVALAGTHSVFTKWDGQLIAIVLLFSMGLQNSLVTKVSRSVVRTTHLTGLFTDLGIELSGLFFHRKPEEQQQLRRNIRLKITIITSFFMGCIVGGLAYKRIDLDTLFIPVVVLIFTLLYNNIQLRYYLLKRKILAGKLNG